MKKIKKWLGVIKFTGRCDMFGEKIYEGDKVSYSTKDVWGISTETEIVKWDKNCCGYQPFVRYACCEYLGEWDSENIFIVNNKLGKK